MNVRRKVRALDTNLEFISMCSDMGVDGVLLAECSQAFSSQLKKRGLGISNDISNGGGSLGYWKALG